MKRGDVLSERLSELERILEEVKSADEVSKTTRTQFWKIVCFPLLV